MTREPLPFEAPGELVTWEPSNEPVLSCYVDWSVSGRGLHEAPTVIRHELRKQLRALDPGGEAHTSLSADAERLERFLEEEADPAAQGFAIFACSGRELWRVMALGLPIETRVHVGERPLLLPLVEATQDAARTLVVLANTNTARLITLAPGGPSEAEGPHRPVATVKHSTAGGWGALGYQRHVDTEIARFAEEVAAAIEEAVLRQHLAHVVLTGDDVILTPLTQALSDQVRERLDEARHMDIHEDTHDVAERVWPEIAQIVSRRREAEVESVVGRAKAGNDALNGPAEVMEAVLAGRVDTLVIDATRVQEAAAELALREALAHRSRVLIVRGHAAFAEGGGLAATLR